MQFSKIELIPNVFRIRGDCESCLTIPGVEILNRLVSNKNSANCKRVAIVGGGISGLSAAYFLLQEADLKGAEIDLIILESSGSVGGSIKTFRYKETVLDLGPECFVATKPAVLELSENLGIDSRIVTQAQRKTFIAVDSVLYGIPDGLFSMNPKIADLLTSNLFSPSGKLRMAGELFVSRRIESTDETLADFVERRFGREFLERIAEPIVGGLYGTTPESLSARSTLPYLVGLELSHGSVIRGMLTELTNRKKREASHAIIKGDLQKKGTMATFDQGMVVLVEELKKHIAGRCKLVSAEVESIQPGEKKGWQIHCSNTMNFESDAVVVALPASAASTVLAKTDKVLSDNLSLIRYSSPIVVNLIYDQNAFSKQLIGSGFLVPRKERGIVRACTFSSNKFKRNVGDDQVVLRASLDTSMDPCPAMQSDDQIQKAVAADLKKYLSTRNDPIFSMVTRHKKAIPQFAPGHQDLLDGIERRQEQFSNLALIGNAYGGMGVADCVARAKQECQRIAANLTA